MPPASHWPIPIICWYPRHDRTGIPEAYLREVNSSRVAYLPFDIDRIFWDVLDIDHARLLKNLVLWTLGEAPPAIVEGPGILDVTLWEQEHSMALHLVNFTNPMMMKGPCRELLPVGAQKVRVPSGREIKRVRLLTADAAPVHRVEDGCLHAVVPGVLEHKILAVDFA